MFLAKSGEYWRFLVPGDYVVYATKDGYIDEEERVEIMQLNEVTYVT